MFKRLTAVLLLLAFGAGVASGAPLRTGSKECAMGKSMEMMDCCKRARAHGNTPENLAARLCCAVNCQSGGANAPAPAARLQAPQAPPAHPAAAPAPSESEISRARRRDLASHPNESPPVYLLNLTFLI